MKPNHSYTDAVRIGLLADSHGNLPATVSCIRRLRLAKVDLMMHLGDFFDSLGDKNLLNILNTIQQNNILTVKGNNDYQVEKALDNGSSILMPSSERKRVSGFLKGVPMKRVISDICFAHSLPYDSIRSFYEPVDIGTPDQAVRLFNHTPYRIIFCGHSHHPVVFRWRSGGVTREGINPEKPLCLKASERYIIIVGSAESGECGLFDVAQNIYQRIRI
jgi:predicted phosphodiesterase